MKVHQNMVQGSKEWLEIRSGRPTTSQFGRIITPSGEPSKQAAGYMVELAAEHLIKDHERGPGEISSAMLAKLITPGKLADSSAWEEIADTLIAECIRPDQSATFDGNYDTDRGTEMEPVAREEFSRIMKLEVIEVGFVTRDDGIVGCSPDGLIPNQSGEFVAGLEIKNPKAKHHVRYKIDNILPQKYGPQVHGGMAVTGLNHWYFTSRCEGMESLIIRVDRDGYTQKVSDALDGFLIDYSKALPALKEKLREVHSRFMVYYQSRYQELVPRLLRKEAA